MTGFLKVSLFSTMLLCAGVCASFNFAFAQEDRTVLNPPAPPVLPQVGSEPRPSDVALPSPEFSAAQAAGQGDGFVYEIEKTDAEIEQEVRDQAFDAAISGLLPLKPSEIRAVLERYDETKQAVEIPVYPYPEPEIAVETVSLDPGATPPTIKVAVGHVTTLNIVDITGAPWPIQDLSWAGDFEILQPEEGSNIVRITPMTDFTHGNMSLRLLTLKTPVIFTMRTHRDTVQYRFDARIPEYGPYAEAPIIEGGISLVAGSSTLSAVLDGRIPDGAQRLDVSGVDSRTTAYNYNSQTYVRTPLTLLSPGWSNSVVSADGMNVYVVASAPVLLLSDGGQMVRARLSARDNLDD